MIRFKKKIMVPKMLVCILSTAILLAVCIHPVLAAVLQGEYITAEEARKIAEDNIPDTKVTEVELEQKKSGAKYEISLSDSEKKYEIEINAATGEIIKTKEKQIDRGSKDIVESADMIGWDAAKRIASEHAGISFDQAVFTEEQLDKEDGVLVYEMEFVAQEMRYEYEINALTGEIMKQKQKSVLDSKKITEPEEIANVIGLDAAKNIVLNHAGLSEQDIVFTELETKKKDSGNIIYEIEFFMSGTEYEYSVDAKEGTILEFEIEKD